MCLVDGLRGLAALSVVFFHFLMAARLPHEHAAWMPLWLEWVLEHCWLGVQCFFVLSGFVIAYSLRGLFVTPAVAGRFVLRRALRLDPPYWCAIAIEVVLLAVLGLSWEGAPRPVDWGQIGAHLMYAQEFLGYEHIVGVFWTLCVEVQLYLSFVLLLMLAQRLSGTRGEAPGRRSLPFVLAFVPLVVVTLFAFSRGGSWLPWGLSYAYMFLLGAFTWWALDGFLSVRWLLALAGAVVAVLGFVPWELKDHPMAVMALSTAGLLYLAGRLGTLGTWLSWRPIQVLGRLSYSLYLIHLVVGDRIMRSILHAYGRTAVSWSAGCALGLTASLLAAWLLSGGSSMRRAERSIGFPTARDRFAFRVKWPHDGRVDPSPVLNEDAAPLERRGPPAAPSAHRRE